MEHGTRGRRNHEGPELEGVEGEEEEDRRLEHGGRGYCVAVEEMEDWGVAEFIGGEKGTRQ